MLSNWVCGSFFLNSQVVFHQKFPGMGLMTLMPIAIKQSPNFRAHQGRSAGESLEELSLSLLAAK